MDLAESQAGLHRQHEGDTTQPRTPGKSHTVE